MGVAVVLRGVNGKVSRVFDMGNFRGFAAAKAASPGISSMTVGRVGSGYTLEAAQNAEVVFSQAITGSGFELKPRWYKPVENARLLTPGNYTGGVNNLDIPSGGSTVTPASYSLTNATKQTDLKISRVAVTIHSSPTSLTVNDIDVISAAGIFTVDDIFKPYNIIFTPARGSGYSSNDDVEATAEVTFEPGGYYFLHSVEVVEEGYGFDVSQSPGAWTIPGSSGALEAIGTAVFASMANRLDQMNIHEVANVLVPIKMAGGKEAFLEALAVDHEVKAVEPIITIQEEF